MNKQNDPSQRLLFDRKILITGASSGVGRHLAITLASHGAAVACCARRLSDLNSVVDLIEAAGGQAAAVSCDVSDAESIVSAFDRAEEALGGVDSVICNAGVSRPGSTMKLSLKDIDSVLDVNLRGSLLTAREGAIRMTGDSASRARRRIIFISSILGTKPESGAATYNATKAGVNLLSKSLAIEWAKHGITVNTVSPGYMQTEIIDEFFEKPAGEAMINRWPAKEFMPIAALDPAVLFLLSESAQFTTGAEIIVDEGQSLT